MGPDHGRLRIWDLTSGRQLLTLDRDRIGGLPAANVGAPALRDRGLSLQAWNDAGTHLALSVQRADPGPDGKVVVRAEWSVAIVEVPSGRIVRTVPTGSSMPVASFRPDGKLLAIGTNVAGVRGTCHAGRAALTRLLGELSSN